MSDGTNLPMLPVKHMADLEAVGKAIAQSGMFGVQNAASGLVVACTCHQQGITLMEFNRTYHIVDGKPSMKADAMIAAFRKAGGKYVITENSTSRASAEFEFEGQTVPFEFTIEDAKRTGDCYQKDGKTLKHTWLKRPDDMLWARMVSRAVRRLAPEIVAGLYTPEEVSDFDDKPRGSDKIVEIDASEVASRIVENTDYTACPEGFGEYSGKTWSDIETDILETAKDADNLTPTHKAAIRLVLESRKGATS